MNNEPKPRGGSKSELTRFKILWRDTLPESSRDYWRSRFQSSDTQVVIRAEIHSKTGINLLYDNQLTEFRNWELQQRLRDIEQEQMLEDERRLAEQHGDWTLDQVREEVLKTAYARSMATGDFKLGLSTMDRDLTLKDGKTRGALEEAKLELRKQAEARNAEKLVLERQKFQRAVVAKTLDAETQRQAKEIASRNISHGQKIDALGKAMFGKDWEE